MEPLSLSPVSQPVATFRVAEQAEELIRTLPGVVSVRVVEDSDGSVQEIHILTTTEISAKQTVRNVESAMFAHVRHSDLRESVTFPWHLRIERERQLTFDDEN